MASSSSSFSSDHTAALDALLQPFDRADAPGLLLGVAWQGRTVYQRGVGLACVELGVPMTPRTRVRIASTSKHFAALGVLLLVEEGKLHLDDLIYQHLPELPVLHPTGPTLRQLMQHTGGWRSDLAALAQGLALEPLADWSKPLQVWDRGLNFEPGTRMVYSNSGYRLLALLIQRISGLGFEEFLKQRVFEPLGLHHTESLDSDLEIRPGLALQYLPLPGPARPEGAGPRLQRGLYPGELRGGGSLISNLDDMLCWLAHLRSPDKLVGSAASWAQMLEPTRLSTGVELPYGLGLMRHDYRGVEVIHHAGAVLGATSQMITVPAHELDIMVMANGAPVSTVALAFQVIDALLGEAEQGNGVLGPRAQRLPSASHQPLLGQRYHAAETGALLSFEDVGGQLGMAWMAGRPMLLRVDGEEAVLPCEDTALNTVSVPLAALAAVDGQPPEEITISDGGHPLRCLRLPAAAPLDDAALATLAADLGGRYLLPDLGPDVHARVQREDGQLVMRLQGAYGRNAMRLQPLAADLLLGLPLDPLMGAVGGGMIVHAERPGDAGAAAGSGLASRVNPGPVVALRLDGTRARQVRVLREPQSPA